jgi:CHASE1-domain containing sensor protein
MPEELSFFDVKTKNKFTSTDYRIETRGHRRFAVAKIEGEEREAWRILPKVQNEQTEETQQNDQGLQ